MAQLRGRQDTVVLDLVEESGRNVQRASLLLRDLVADYPERAGLARDLFLCEQEGDRITHDIILRLRGPSGQRMRRPFDALDGCQLASAVDDVVDFAEQTADTFGIYHVEAPMEQAGQLAEVLVGCGEQVALALSGLRTGAELSRHLVEINRLEDGGDRISRDAVGSLFHDGIDPMVVIRWKDIFEALEAGVDAGETVAHVLEGIAIKQRDR